MGDGNCYFVDSTHSNNWRELRIRNSTMNWAYVEYDPAWKFVVNDIQHYELYDVTADPYQMGRFPLCFVFFSRLVTFFTFISRQFVLKS